MELQFIELEKNEKGGGFGENTRSSNRDKTGSDHCKKTTGK
jgi:hypothetical protein